MPGQEATEHLTPDVSHSYTSTRDPTDKAKLDLMGELQPPQHCYDPRTKEDELFVFYIQSHNRVPTTQTV